MQALDAFSVLPRYRNRSTGAEVHASRVTTVSDQEDALWLHHEYRTGDTGLLVPVTRAWLDQHKPDTHGWYVLHGDGSANFSPDEVFESDYTRIAE